MTHPDTPSTSPARKRRTSPPATATADPHHSEPPEMYSGSIEFSHAPYGDRVPTSPARKLIPRFVFPPQSPPPRKAAPRTVADFTGMPTQTPGTPPSSESPPHQYCPSRQTEPPYSGSTFPTFRSPHSRKILLLDLRDIQHRDPHPLPLIRLDARHHIRHVPHVACARPTRIFLFCSDSILRGTSVSATILHHLSSASASARAVGNRSSSSFC